MGNKQTKLQTFSQLINMRYNEAIARDAADKYPTNVNKAMDYCQELIQTGECVSIVITAECKRNVEYCKQFDLIVPYSENKQYSLKQLVKDAEKYIDQQHNPIQFGVKRINRTSFIGKEVYANGMNIDWREWDCINIIDYCREDIKCKGLQIVIDIAIYEHKVTSLDITCCNILTSKDDESNIDLSCPIYAQMKYEYQFNENNLKHLYEFNHFKNEFVDKPECKYADDCHAHKRLQKGENKLSDRCHVKLFRHPPRSRNNGRIMANSSQEINAFCLNKDWSQNNPLYEPTEDDEKKYDYNKTDGYLKALIDEVVGNGFKSDLMLSQDDEKDNNFSIMQVVSEKRSSIRHKQMASPLNKAEMLSVILYTGCDANYDLCSTQRNRDYKKWKWFDYCLYNAINKLSKRERGVYKIYTGLSGTKLKQKYVDSGYFTSYVSTSWIKDIALSFIDDDGMLFEIDEKFRENSICCDVSWISKFSDECEILIARSIDAVFNNFECKVVDTNGVQTILLSQYGTHRKLTKIVESLDNKPIKSEDLVIEDHAEEKFQKQLEKIKMKQLRRDEKEKENDIGLEDTEEELELTLISQDMISFKVCKNICYQSAVIKTMWSGDKNETEILLSNVRGSILNKIIKYMKYHHDNPAKEIEKPLKSANMREVVSEWDANFVEVDQETLFELILAANYMDIRHLLDLTCAKVASMIKGKTAKEIRQKFNIQNDFTPEEEEAVRAENKWADDS